MFSLSNYIDFDKACRDEAYRNSKGIKMNRGGSQPLVIFKYNKESINDENVDTLGLFRSIVYDKNERKVVCVSPPKSKNINTFQEKYKLEECVVKEFVEGTMINVFHYNNNWEIATKSCIGGHFKYFKDSKKTFRQMFLEAIMGYDNFDLNDLDKTYCYSFVLQHPENTIVTPFSIASLIFVSAYKIHNSIEEDTPKITFEDKTNDVIMNIKCSHILRFSEVCDFDDKATVWKYVNDYYFTHDKSYSNKGFVVYSNSNPMERIKFRNPAHEYVKDLRGNSSKKQFRFYNLRKLRKINEYLSFYPKERDEFSGYRNQLHTWTHKLHDNYIRCFINKELHVKECSYEFRPHLFELHKMYLSTLRTQRKKINFNTVANYVNNLEPARLMYSVNYSLREPKVEKMQNEYDRVRIIVSESQS